MKINTSEVARTVGLHPAQLLLCVADMDTAIAFGDVWPEIDDGWTATIASSLGQRLDAATQVSKATQKPQPKAAVPMASENACRVLDKLTRNGRWGKVSVSFDTARNLTHLSRHDLEEAIAELRRDGLLDHDGGRGQISLNSGQRQIIEEILQPVG